MSAMIEVLGEDPASLLAQIEELRKQRLELSQIPMQSSESCMTRAEWRRAADLLLLEARITALENLYVACCVYQSAIHHESDVHDRFRSSEYGSTIVSDVYDRTEKVHGAALDLLMRLELRYMLSSDQAMYVTGLDKAREEARARSALTPRPSRREYRMRKA